MSWGDLWAALIALFALIVSLWQLRWTQRESLKRQTLEHLRGVVRLVQEARPHDLKESQTDALAFYRCHIQEMSPAARTHLQLLDEMDLLSLGIVKGAVDGDLAREYLRSTYADAVPDTIHFINHLRECFEDPELYFHLYEILPTLPAPPPRWVSSYTPDTEDPYERG